MSNVSAYMSSTKKCLAALTGAAAVAVTAGVLPAAEAHWVSGILAVATAFITYLVPNAPTPGTAAAIADDTLTADADVTPFPVYDPSLDAPIADTNPTSAVPDTTAAAADSPIGDAAEAATTTLAAS